MFKLVPEWKRVMALSISFWMQVFGLLVLILPEIWFAFTGEDYDPVFLWWLGVLLLVAGLVGRIFQQGISHLVEWLRIAGIGVIVLLLAVLLASKVHAEPPSEWDTLSVAVPFIASEEGERNSAYRDIVGVPTICFGSTRGVTMGMTKTHTECMALLRDEVKEFRNGLHRYFGPTTIAARLTAKRDAAYTSTAFNCGIGAIGKSTATRRLNAGDIPGGCQALTWWNKAGGRVIRGLVARRARERDLCMAGL